MGTFRIEIDAVGGHGCSRGTRNGEIVTPCNQEYCPDCAARKFVAQFKQMGVFNYTPAAAILRHWPGTDDEIVDDLLSGVRKGQFQ